MEAAMLVNRIRYRGIQLLTAFCILFLAACRTGDDSVTSDTPVQDQPPGPTLDVVIGEVQVNRIALNMMESFPIQMSVRVQGVLPDECSEVFAMPQEQAGNTLVLPLISVRDTDEVCAQVSTPFNQVFMVDVLDLPAATYTVDVNGMLADFTFTQDNSSLVDPYSACPGSTEDKNSLINEDDGFCLLYPEGFEVMEDSPGTVIISGQPYDDSLEPLRATLTIQYELRTEGRSAKVIADAFLEEFADWEDFEIVRSVIMLGGESAEVADGVPGRGLHRMAFVVYSGREYILALAPFDEAFSIVRGDLELLWQTVISSWVFLAP
jgi:hypothetical protein